MTKTSAVVSIDNESHVWGHGPLGELLDGVVYHRRGTFYYQTFRGHQASGSRLSGVLNIVATDLGYSGATVLPAVSG